MGLTDEPTEYERRREAKLAKLTPGKREDFDERAGIMQFCGGATKVAAERAAYNIITRAKPPPRRIGSKRASAVR